MRRELLIKNPGLAPIAGLRSTSKAGNAEGQLDLVLLMGDQVYVDPTAGLADPKAPDERYLQPYQNLYRSSEVREVLRKVPSYMMLDDHEIADNWEPLPYPDLKNETALTLGRKHYLNFQRGPQQPTKGMHSGTSLSRTVSTSLSPTRVRNVHVAMLQMSAPGASSARSRLRSYMIGCKRGRRKIPRDRNLLSARPCSLPGSAERWRERTPRMPYTATAGRATLLPLHSSCSKWPRKRCKIWSFSPAMRTCPVSPP